ncbi:MAG: SDR family oxidoreductase [Herbiconiux sp.]|nr:SDR family oxidoreductase [Herbiconiux sp.]
MSGSLSLTPAPGLRVLVTGGTSGIGLAIVTAFESFGARVHVCGTDRARLDGYLAAVPGRTGTLCDVSDPEQVAALFSEASDVLGGLDVLVNNAGIAGPTAKVVDVAVEEWRQTIDIDLTGAFLCAQAAVPLLTASRGSIVNISSVAGRLGYALRAPYNAAKFGLDGLTQSLARELGPDGIRVNAVLPGFVDSARFTRTTAARAAALGVTPASALTTLLEKTSLKTMVSEEEVALLVAYLCSSAGRNISGQAISLDGNVEYL